MTTLRAGKLARRAVAGAIVVLALSAPPGDARDKKPPHVSASAGIVVDAGDGHVLYRRSPDERLPIASTTKLMTALLSIEKLPLNRRIRAAPYNASPAESQIGLRTGERMTVADLLRALMLASANDAAETLARGAGGSVRSFVRLMNRKADALGLAHTHYANPVGLDEGGNYSSARDLARLARTVLKQAFLAETVSMRRARLLSGARERIVNNRNALVGRVPWIDGVKTGHTAEAGYVLVGSGTRKGVKLVSVVLGTPSESARDDDTLALLDYGFGLYRRVHALRASVPVAHASVEYFGDRVPLLPARRFTVALRRGERLRTSVNGPGQLHGPIAARVRVGTVTVLVNGKPVKTVALVTGARVPGAGFFRKLTHYAVRPLLLLALIVVALLAADRRRRRVHAAEAARRRRRRAASAK